MPIVMDPTEVAKTNPGVDPKKVEEAIACRKALEQGGSTQK